MIRSEKDERILCWLSEYLNVCPDAISPDMMRGMENTGYDLPERYALLVGAVLGLEGADMRLLLEEAGRVFIPCRAETFSSDPYLKTCVFDDTKTGSCELKRCAYAPFEAFPCGEMTSWSDGAVLPRIGWFEEGFSYPALYSGGRMYMSVTPNEILTISPAAKEASGHVLALGLGMAYFVFMAQQNLLVDDITVVEYSKDVIRLYEKCIKQWLPKPEKVNIIYGDAFEKAPELYRSGRYDFVFADLWHDASDGPEMYPKLKNMEHLAPKAVFRYWIEDTLKYYI